MSKNLKLLLIGVGMALTLPLAAQAQYPDRDDRQDDWREREHRHPHYVHAMADVSAAFLLIKHVRGDPAAIPEEERAMVDIEYAFTTLKNAGDVVRKDTDDIPPPQDHNHYDHRGRLHRALDLLNDAYDQVNRGEEDPDARGQKHSALEQIGDAAHATEEAIRVRGY